MLVGDLFHWYKANKTVEHIEPFAGGVIAGLVSVGLGWHMPCDLGTQNSALSASMTVGSIIFGFLTSGMIMMLSFNGSRIRQVDQSGFIHDIVRYFSEAILLVVLFIMVSLLGFFIEATRLAYMGLWVGSGVASLLGFRRLFTILSWLLNDRG